MESLITNHGPLMYAVQDVPDRGKGLVATRMIPRGTRILSEEPIMAAFKDEEDGDNEKLQASICEQVDSLSNKRRKAFFHMYNAYPYENLAERCMGIFQTNALPMQSDVGNAGIFLKACRLNHACDNNAQRSWNENIKRHTVHAIRDIEKGEEITIYYYMAFRKNRRDRQQVLREKFGFTCTCQLCSLPAEESAESDRRLDEIQRLRDLFSYGDSTSGIRQHPLEMLHLTGQRAHLYIKQAGPISAGLSRAYQEAALILIANGDLARGRIFAERAAAGWRTIQGGDSTNAKQLESAARNPAGYLPHGLWSNTWTTAVDDVPDQTNLDTDAFEDWLWRRTVPQTQRSLHSSAWSANLRNRATFLSFDDLPSDTVINLEFDEVIVGGSASTGARGRQHDYKPRRHWCFLGEITGVRELRHVALRVAGVDGGNVSLHFYTPRLGAEMESASLRKGYTAALLYARYSEFKHSEPGIRHEDARLLKIFPISLQSLLVLSDQVQQFAREVDGLRTCHSCGRKAAAAELQRCAKCLCFWYCDKDCQIIGWKEKKHKNYCKVLQDEDLKGLFSLDWNNFEGPVQFPLRPATSQRGK